MMRATIALCVLAFLAMPALAGTIAEPQWQQDEDHQACLAKGLAQGTDAYDECRVQMSNDHIREANLRAAHLTQWSIEKRGSSFHGPGDFAGLGSHVQGQIDATLAARVMTPGREKSTVTTTCTSEDSGAGEQKNCTTETTIETKPTPAH